LIDFSSYISDVETSDANLLILIRTLPTEGKLTTANGDADEGKRYAVNAITYTLYWNECVSSYSDKFEYTVYDELGEPSSRQSVNISARAKDCPLSSIMFTSTITETATIDFTTHVTDFETSYSLPIKLTSLPKKGKLTTSDGDADTDSSYALDAITYTSNASECALAYSDSFDYSVIDVISVESSVGTVMIDAKAFNCMPVSTSFEKAITGTDTIDFSKHVSDVETNVANLTIKVETLPSKGVLTASNATAVEGTAYAISAITYTSNASQCE